MVPKKSWLHNFVSPTKHGFYGIDAQQQDTALSTTAKQRRAMVLSVPNQYGLRTPLWHYNK
jgi:hypothetical protein